MNENLTCSICGEKILKEEMVFTRFREPACRACFWFEKRKASIVLHFCRNRETESKLFSPSFNFWETNTASYPEPVKYVIGDFNGRRLEEKNYSFLHKDPSGSTPPGADWRWVLKENYKAAASGSIISDSASRPDTLYSLGKELGRRLKPPVEAFILVKHQVADKRILFEIIAEKEFFRPALKWCAESEPLIIKELSYLFRG